jgi:glycoside/pentoside/hexuronide:cation symporter, GPH family
MPYVALTPELTQNYDERTDFARQERPKPAGLPRSMMRNRPFVFSMVMFLLTWMAIDLLQATLLYFIKFVLNREVQTDLIMAAIFVTALVVLPIWQRVSRTADKRIAYVIGIAFWAVVQVALVFLGAAPPPAVVLGVCVLPGIGVAAAHVLPWAIIPDAIEWDEWRTGKHHEGVFYSIVTLVQKIASSLIVPLALLALQAVGYIPSSAAQPERVVTALRVLVSPVPMVLLAAGILFALFYPLDRDQHGRIVAALEARRASAHRASGRPHPATPEPQQ